MVDTPLASGILNQTFFVSRVTVSKKFAFLCWIQIRSNTEIFSGIIYFQSKAPDQTFFNLLSKR
jgi:hypothetical protein